MVARFMREVFKLKSCMLILLLSAQRVQTLYLLRTDNLACKKVVQDSVTHLKEYPLNKRLCVVQTLMLYLTKTGSLRGEEKCLFKIYKRPHCAVSKDTIPFGQERFCGVQDLKLQRPQPKRDMCPSVILC